MRVSELCRTVKHFKEEHRNLVQVDAIIHDHGIYVEIFPVVHGVSGKSMEYISAHKLDRSEKPEETLKVALKEMVADVFGGWGDG